jgi:hypothetical protein
MRGRIGTVLVLPFLSLACGQSGGGVSPRTGGASDDGSSSGAVGPYPGSDGAVGAASDAAAGDATATGDAALGGGHSDAPPGTGSDAAGPGGGSGPDASPPPDVPFPHCTTDITASILAGSNVALNGDSCIVLPAGTTAYAGIISATGTLTLTAPNGPGTLVVTGDSTFTLPPSQQTETATKTGNYYVIHNPNPPCVFIEPNATLALGTATSTTGSIASLLPGTGTSVINGDNIEVDGTLAMGGGPTEHFGILSGTGTITQPGYAAGTFYLVGDHPFAGILSILSGGNIGDLGVVFSFPYAKAIFNNGSMIMNSPPAQGFTLPETVYESHYGDDINTDHGVITFAGVYSYSNSGDPLHPSLSDPSLNQAVVKNTGASPTHANGSNASFRGINLEGGTTQWGDGTTDAFFLPSAPAPADPSAASVKNAYVNLHRGSTLVFDYSGKYTCDIGITGGGGGPNASASVGVGNLTIAPTPGNYAVLTMPQNYNGTTTIGAGATLQLGAGAPVQAMGATVGAPTAAEPNGAVTKAVLATYSGDSSLLIAQSPTGAANDSIVDNGTLVVNNTTSAILLSNISGAGALVQSGLAATTLIANTYAGGTTIGGGLLIVGSDTSLGTGSLINDAGLTTASGQNVIRVAGDYRQGAAATLTLGIGGMAQGMSYDYLAITGKAVLAGTLVVNDVGGFTPVAGQQFTLVQAAGGISGAFSTITSAAIRLTLTYDATHCYATAM